MEKPNRKDKQKYIVHIKNLNEALKHGLKLKKVHWVITSEHSHWMKLYAMSNTKLRTTAKGEFEKDAFKLMNSRVF